MHLRCGASPRCACMRRKSSIVCCDIGDRQRTGASMTSNADIVVDQFTRQATPFASSSAMRDEDALRLLVEFSGAIANDTVLDVACGPGLVVAAFARVCRHATGV